MNIGKACRNSGVEVDNNVWYLAQKCINSSLLNLTVLSFNPTLSNAAGVKTGNVNERASMQLPAMQRHCFGTLGIRCRKLTDLKEKK
jgi:hypothetical protein